MNKKRRDKILKAWGDGAITSSKNGLFPLLILVLWVWPHTFTLTTGLMLLPGSWRPSKTRTRIWTWKEFPVTSSSLRWRKLGHQQSILFKYEASSSEQEWWHVGLFVSDGWWNLLWQIWLFRKEDIGAKTIPGSPEVCWPRLWAFYDWVGLAFGRFSQAGLLKWQRTHLHLGPLRPQGPPLHRRHCRLLRGKIDYFHLHSSNKHFHVLLASTFDASPSGWLFTLVQAFGGGSYLISKFTVAWKMTRRAFNHRRTKIYVSVGF